MSVEDLNSIKAIVTLATGLDDVFLSISRDFIRDQSTNRVVVPNQRLSVSDYIADTGCPSLSNFDLDLDVGLFSLTFYEPVNTSTFDLSTLTLLSGVEEMYTLTAGEFETGLYALSRFDFDLLSANEALATSSVDTYVMLSEMTLQDAAGNYYCNDTSPTPVTVFTADATPPVLLNFTLNLLTETLTLTFTETVRIPLTPSAITLLAQPDMQISFSGSGSGSGNMASGSGSGMEVDIGLVPNVAHHTLTGGNSTIDYSMTPHIVSFQLIPDDLNAIKNQPGLATSMLNTYLALTMDVSSDYFSNPVVPISPLSPLMVSEFTSDNTPPELVSFGLNVDTKMLLLSFSEFVNITSFDVTSITLQSGADIGVSTFYTLQSSSAMLETLTEINVLLSEEDINAIKAISSLATEASNTYISIPSDLVRDSFGLPVVSISNSSALPVTLFMADISPPLLLRFTLNLTSEELILTFDETVDVSTLLIPRLAIQSDEEGSGRFSLMNGTATSVDSTVVAIFLSEIDLYNLKNDRDLATDDNNTCVYLEFDAIRDLSMVPVSILASTNCNATFYEDTLPPVLTDYVVNINASILILNFDEPVDIDTVNETVLTLQAREMAGPRVQEVTLSGGTVSTIDSLEVVLTLTLSDLNLIKQNLNLLVNLESSFLRLDPDFISDVNGNRVTAISADLALQAAMFVEDTTNPSLQSFDIDMNTGHLTLYFSETVDISTLDFTGITLQRMSRDMAGTSHTLTGGVRLGRDAPVITIELTNDDLNVLKTRDIARTNESVFITLVNGSIFDVSNQPVNLVSSGVNAIPVSGYIPDSNPPMLLDFSLDLTAETLTLSFNESVDYATLNVSHITLTMGVNVTDEDLAYALDTSVTEQTSNLPELVIRLSPGDLNEIKRRDQLATSESDTYIFLTPDALADTFGNMVVEIIPSNTVLVSDYERDGTDPVLIGFNFDADNGNLTLTFSETVNSSSLNTGGITLTNGQPDLQSYTLSGDYTLVTPPFNVITVVLTNNDLNQIKILDMLAVDNATLFLSLTTNTISDMDDNPIRRANRLGVTDFTPDTTPPQLTDFTINMNRGELTLTFDETVNSSSLVFEYLALINNETFMPIPVNPDSQHQLSGGEVLTDNLPFLTFAFTEEDLNEIKRQDMCTRALRELDCFLVYRTNAVMDMSGNGIDGCRQVDT